MQALWIVIGSIGVTVVWRVRRPALLGGGDERLTPRSRAGREPLRPIRLFGLFFRVGALNELQYRANFAVQVFQSVDRAR